MTIVASDESGDLSLMLDASDGSILPISNDHVAFQGHLAYTEYRVYLESGLAPGFRLPPPS